MEYETFPEQGDGPAFHIKDVLGDIRRVEEMCPGVYYVAVRGGEQSLFAREYYIVEADAPAIPQNAKKYGQPISGCPGLLLYSIQEERGGHKIIEYEIARYKTEHGIPLPHGETLREIKVFNMEYHPEYFGPYPVPDVTPGGSVRRHYVLDNGVYWLEPERDGPLLAVCCPIWGDLSDYAMKLSRLTAYGQTPELDDTLECVFFSEHDSCVPIFELLTLREEWTRSGKIKEAALMNAIWAHHPEYAVAYNTEELAGWHDVMGLLLQTVGHDAELTGSPQNMIRLTLGEGTDFLHV